VSVSMRQVDKVERFLRAQVAEHGSRIRPRSSAGETRPFVTISRQSGAGAHELADTLVRVFSRQPDSGLFGVWQVFDRELCEMVATDPQFSGWLDSLIDEEYPSRMDSFFGQVIRSAPDRARLFSQVSRVVRAVATIGKAIIIGRGGSEVTRDMVSGVSIRLTAPRSARTRRIMEQRGMKTSEARRAMRRLDRGRARLVEDRFGVRIDDPDLYDLAFDAGNTTFEEMAEVVAALLRSRAGVKQDQ